MELNPFIALDQMINRGEFVTFLMSLLLPVLVYSLAKGFTNYIHNEAEAARAKQKIDPSAVSTETTDGHTVTGIGDDGELIFEDEIEPPHMRRIQ